MARTSLKAIEIPEGVTLENNQGVLSFTGKLGNMTLEIHGDVEINQEENSISFSPNKDTKESLAITGTMRALTANYIKGVVEGFEKKLEIKGVGYRANLEGNSINLSLGFSHPIKHELPEGVTAELPSNTEIILKSMDKQLVGQVAAEIRDYRPPEPYKGKGIKYVGERILRKAGKSGKK